MTLCKLSLRNARRQANDYAVYFVTMTLVAAMLYAFNGLVFSREIQALSDALNNLPLIIVMASLVVVLIVGWLVSYTTGFMFSRRSRELGTYLLIGMERQQVKKLFFLENTAVGAVALLFGLPLGCLIFQGLRAILMTMFCTPYRFSFAFSSLAVELTLLYFAAIYLFALGRSGKSLRRMKIRDLMDLERRNEQAMVRTGAKRRSLFAASLILEAAGTSLLLMGELSLGILGAGCMIVGLYGFFTGFSSGIPAFFEKKPARKFQGQRLLIFRSLSAKLASTGVVMATVSVLFTAAVLTEGTGMVLHGIIQGRVERDGFDLLFVTDQEGREEEFLAIAGAGIPLAKTWRYPLYQGEDNGMVRYLTRHSDYMPFSYSHDYNGEVLMAQSDYNALRDMLGLPTVEFQPDTYSIHCMPYLKKTLSQWAGPISQGGWTLELDAVHTEEFCQNNWNGNGHQVLLVVPDAVTAACPVIRYAVAAQTREPVTAEQYNALDAAVEQVVNGRSSAINGWDMLHCKTDAIREAAYSSAMAVFPLSYLALTLALTAATVLTVQQLSEAGRLRSQCALLEKLGMDRKEMEKVLLWILAIYYAMPVIPPVLIAIPFVLTLGGLTEPGTLAGITSPPSILAVCLGLFFLIYFLYMVIAYTSMRKTVLP